MNEEARRRERPLQSTQWQCSDRWHRKLKDGSEVSVALWFHGPKGGQLYLELAFTSGDGSVVGPIADEIMEVLDRHRMPWGEQVRLCELEEKRDEQR
jgi:hypothetical protein